MAASGSGQTRQTVAVVLMAVGDRLRHIATDRGGCISLERQRWLRQTRAAEVGGRWIGSGSTDGGGGGGGSRRQAEIDTDRRLHQTRGATDGCVRHQTQQWQSVNRIGSDWTDGGSGGDSSGATDRDRFRQTQTHTNTNTDTQTDTDKATDSRLRPTPEMVTVASDIRGSCGASSRGAWV